MSIECLKKFSRLGMKLFRSCESVLLSASDYWLCAYSPSRRASTWLIDIKAERNVVFFFSWVKKPL